MAVVEIQVGQEQADLERKDIVVVDVLQHNLRQVDVMLDEMIVAQDTGCTAVGADLDMAVHLDQTLFYLNCDCLLTKFSCLSSKS